MNTNTTSRYQEVISSPGHTAFEKPDTITIVGYILLSVTAGLYALEESGLINVSLRTNSHDLTLFFIHYAFSVVYGLILLSDNSYALSWSKSNINKTTICLNLFLVSAYALNREVSVFAESTTWLCVQLVLTSLVMLTYPYLDALPRYLKYVHHMLLGASLILFIYMTIYVSNYYIFGTIGLVFFGIGGHIFVPAFFVFTLVKLTIRTHKDQNIGPGWIYLGAAMAIAFTMSFVAQWKSRVTEINRYANQSVIAGDTDIPAWIKVARTVKNDWLTELILKSEICYSVSNLYQWDRFGESPNWDEQRLHDPLVFLASEEIKSLSIADRKNILNVISKNNRHHTQERLWSGTDLSTSYIVTDVDLYPALRLAYSEHYFNVRNSSMRNRSQQEAIYSFELPEGSVVTSLSLWINGVEEKAILASKQKAIKAYSSIVGTRRDPSIIQWHEGNTVSVRVFPCTPDEERKFKIGITSPLSLVDGKASYKNISFKGPSPANAQQSSRIRIIGGTDNVEVPGDFTKNVKNEYVREGNYDQELTIKFDAKAIQRNQFSFDGYRYSLSDLKQSMHDITFNAIYLDINSSWTPVDFYRLKPILEGRKVYAYVNDAFVKVTNDNWDDVIDEMKDLNFSLFPFHHIKDVGRALVITKGSDFSPQLADFKESRFTDGMTNYFAAGNRANVFNLGSESSTYIRSLRELRAFRFAQGDANYLDGLLKGGKFPLDEESDGRVVLHDSRMSIQKTATTGDSDNAPDHLARLFAYNDIMRQVGPNFFKGDFVNEALVKEASAAYVVSPVSSLIVLETQNDYDRFDIKDEGNSLHNATKDSSGAVPEPHEWALILIFLGFVGFQVYKYMKTKLILS